MPFIAIDPATAAAAPVVTAGNPLVSQGRTFLEFQNELISSLGDRDDISLDRIKRWVNNAYVDMATSLALPELRSSFVISVVANQPFYLLPNTVETIYKAAIADTTAYSTDGGIDLFKIDFDIYRKYINLTDDVTSYFQYGKVLVLYPTPSRAVSVVVDYQIRPADMVNNTDSPIVPVEWHEGIDLLALAKAHHKLQEYEASAIARNEYVAFVRRRKDTIAQQRTGSIAAMRRVGSHDDLRRIRNTPLENPY